MFSEEQKNALSAKLDSSHVKTRTQSGRTLSYVEGWWAIAEANRIFGFDGWERKTVAMESLHEPYQNERGNWVVSYRAMVTIRVCADGTWVDRDGSGFGSGFDKEVGRAHESALKEAETDAMKRALMTFGNPFGLALYDKEQANVSNGAEEKPADKPAGRQKNSRDIDWKGPLAKTALQQELRAFAAALADGVHIPEEIDNLLDEYRAVLDQCKVDAPDWWKGGPSVPADYVPLEKRIEAKRKFLDATASKRIQPETYGAG